MKPILFVTDANFLSHLLRSIEIAKAVRKKGYKVIFAAEGIYVDFIAKNGFEYLPVFTNDPVHTMKATRSGMFFYYNSARIKKSVESETECIKKVDPEVIVGDFRWTLRISAEYCKVPYVGIINAIWTPFYAEFRSISEKMLLRKIFGIRFMEKISPFGTRLMMRRRGKPFYRLRKKLGITPIKNLNYEMYGDRNIMPDLPEFCPTKDLPNNFTYIGPLFVSDETLGTPVQKDFPSTPYIYATLGSTATPKMILTLFKALAEQPLPVVMTTGKQPLPASAPDNFILYDYLSGQQAYSNARAVICHGGQGTLYQALSYGIPVIGIATHNDQQWNLDRITVLQLGKQFGEDSCTPKEISEALKEVMDNEVYRSNCLRMRNQIRQYAPAEIAAEEIISFARENTIYKTQEPALR